MKKKISGIITAMVTPLTKTNQIHEIGVERLVNRLIQQKVQGLFTLGTNGEFYALNKEQRLNLVDCVIKTNQGRIPIYVGTGAISTNEVIENTRLLEDKDIDAVSVITPFMIKLREEEIIEHYQEIADNVNLPIILYNIPQNTGISLSAKVVRELAQHPNIIGIKDSSGNMELFKEYLEIKKEQDFSVLIGSDSKIVEALRLGADGAVAATSNFLTNTAVDMYRLIQEKQYEEAEQNQKSIEPFRKILKLGSIPSVLKYALNYRGEQVGVPVKPIKILLTEEEKSAIRNILETYREKENF